MSTKMHVQSTGVEITYVAVMMNESSPQLLGYQKKDPKEQDDTLALLSRAIQYTRIE